MAPFRSFSAPEQLVDIALGMSRVDLEADGLVALRNDRKGEAHGEDAALEESGDHQSHAAGVAHDEGDHWVRAGNRLESERLEPAPELRRARLQVREACAPVGAVGDLDGLRRGGRIRRSKGVRVNVGVGFLPHSLDELGASRHESAVHPERLAEGSDEDVDTRTAVFFRAAARSPVGRDAVRVVHHRHDTVPEAVFMLTDERSRSHRLARCRRAC